MGGGDLTMRVISAARIRQQYQVRAIACCLATAFATSVVAQDEKSAAPAAEIAAPAAERAAEAAEAVVETPAAATPSQACATAGCGPWSAGCASGGCSGDGLYSMSDVITQSMFGKVDNWRPLCLETLFTEGWDEPFSAAPLGSGGAPRHGWLNTVDGWFTREWHAGYFFTDDRADGSDTHVGIYQYQTPLSRRLWVGIDVPFVVAVDGDGGAANAEDFGDIVVIPKIKLYDRRDMSVTAEVGIQIPTGTDVTGGDRTALNPRINVWTDIGCGWSLRGGVGVNVATESSVSPDTAWFTNLAIGRTITSHDDAPLGDFTYYLSMNVVDQLGSSDGHTFASLTPGMRTHLGDNVFFLAGCEVPVTGPTAFDQRLLFLIVRGF